jgi:MYXO-CTERM domain-containing protein
MRLALLTAAVLAVLPSTPAGAFCGFYVAGSDQQMFNDATQVVLMRDGTRTVLAMQNTYAGPPQDFAMVIPVPVVLHEGDVKTLPKEVFAHVEQMGAPRLVEYWEQDPCAPEPVYPMTVASMAPPPSVMPTPKRASLGVTIEAQFVVGEYQILILSAKDSTGLDAWLHLQNYKIPDGAEPLLRPYVEAGMKFFVAKVDPKKVKFENGRAALSPLRFHYDTDDFALPIRLGLANSSGTQDLIVSIFSPHQRYEVANYKNVTIPTNIDVSDAVKSKFGAFYAALFDRTLEKNPGAVVTEYAWQATGCDPCPGPMLAPAELATLGADVLGGTKGKPAPLGDLYDLVLTRLHARYGKDITNDLQFKQASPIVGGREFVVDPQSGKLEEGARPDSTNNFQARYAIRHEWTGPIACANPIRHRWGGPPSGVAAPGTQPATGLAFAPRNQIALPQVVLRDLPEIDVKSDAKHAGSAAAAAAVAPPPPTTTTPATPTATPSPTPPATPRPATAKSGCGCESSDPGSLALVAFGAVALLRRRRPAARGAR